MLNFKTIRLLFRFDEPIYENKVRFVCISDTHEKLRELLPNIPNGDVLIHCGDFTNTCDQNELDEFNDAIGKHNKNSSGGIHNHGKKRQKVTFCRKTNL